jgi:predicted Zn-dependent protease
MIPAQDVVDLVLQSAARHGRADETIVIVTDRAEASLRWAGNSMTTNGVSTSRSTAVISIVRREDTAHIGALRSSVVDVAAIDGLVAASQQAAQTAPEARDAAPLLTGSGTPADWGDPVPGTGAGAFAELARSLSGGFGRADRLYGFAHHIVETTFLATSTGVRRRFTQPTGSVEINAKRGDGSAWAGVSTPWFTDVPADAMLGDLSTRLDWAGRSVELPAGRYETLMPPSTVADMMIYLGWSMDGRGAQEGRTALSAPGGGTSAKACAPVRTKSQRASSHSQSTVVARSSDVCRIETRVAPGALAFTTAVDVCASAKPHVLADGLLAMA